MINHKVASETREKQFDSCNLRKPDIEKDNTHRAYTFTSQIELNLIPRLFTNMNTILIQKYDANTNRICIHKLGFLVELSSSFFGWGQQHT